MHDVLPIQGANVYDILRKETLVLTKESAESLTNRLSTKELINKDKKAAEPKIVETKKKASTQKKTVTPKVVNKKKTSKEEKK